MAKRRNTSCCDASPSNTPPLGKVNLRGPVVGLCSLITHPFVSTSVMTVVMPRRRASAEPETSSPPPEPAAAGAEAALLADLGREGGVPGGEPHPRRCRRLLPGVAAAACGVRLVPRLKRGFDVSLSKEAYMLMRVSALKVFTFPFSSTFSCSSLKGRGRTPTDTLKTPDDCFLPRPRPAVSSEAAAHFSSCVSR